MDSQIRLSTSITSLNDLLQDLPQNPTILDGYVKAWSVINKPIYKNIVCSISGGADSDVMLDICWKCDKDKKITYIYCDTGLEYQATKEHLDYLENKYNIKIKRYLAYEYGMTIPASVKQYGQPFMSKHISDMVYRLQLHDFKWEDKPFEDLLLEYPNCKNALKWWCNNHPENSFFNIKRNKYLKEFMIKNPPTFKIANKCCEKSKKIVTHKAAVEENADLNIIGVRKAEGGVRATAYKNCYSTNGETHQYRPLFWYSDSDRKCYEDYFKITHSKCYTEYGLLRTGCVGCPFGKNLMQEIEIAKQYEPKLYKAINNVFNESYEYTKQYIEFRENKDRKIDNYRQLNLSEFLK